MSGPPPAPFFFTQPLRYLRWASVNKPAYFYSIVVGSAGPVMVFTVPPIRRYMGYEPIPKIPMTYPGMYVVEGPARLGDAKRIIVRAQGFSNRVGGECGGEIGYGRMVQVDLWLDTDVLQCRRDRDPGRRASMTSRAAEVQQRLTKEDRNLVDLIHEWSTRSTEKVHYEALDFCLPSQCTKTVV